MRRLALRIVIPLFLLLLAVAAFEFRDVLHARLGFFSPQGWLRATETLIWLAAAALINGLVVRAIWIGSARSQGREPPKLLVEVVAAAVWLFALIGVVTVTFGRSVTDLVTASSVMIAIIGFSLRAIIADFFYGLSLAMERPFEIGDWVQLDDKTVGQITQMGWRSTRIVTRDFITIVVPNSNLATRNFRNYNSPKRYWRNAIRLRLGHEVPAEQAERLLLSAVAHLPESAASPEPPEARVVGFDGNGVDWELRYWHHDYFSLSSFDDRIRRGVLRNLHMAGIELPCDSRHLMLEQMQEKDGPDAWLGRIELFAGFAPDELHELARVARRRLAPAGESIVRQGEAGASLFVLVEGFLQIFLDDAKGAHLSGHILPGGFFGEMSLLTGAPRAATVKASVNSVVYEITKEDIEPYLHRLPALADQMSRILAVHDTPSRDHVHPERDESPKQLLARIRSFFGLSDGGQRHTG